MGGRSKTASGEHRSRTYHSPRRREQAQLTRERILAAARTAFLTSGYAGTTMAAIAARAGVSRPTLEKAFGTKPELLKQVIDVAIVGDDEPIPVIARASAADAAAAATVDGFLDLVARILTEGQQRSARLVMVALEAATADPTLRPLVRERLDQRSSTAEWILDGVLQRSQLRSDIERPYAVDTVWLLMEPALFCRLTEERQWSTERYRHWFADSVAHLLTAPTSAASPRPEAQR